jgi:predicted dehydrogenase
VATEDGATVLFETSSGVVGVVMLSQVSAGRKNRLRISLEGTARTVDFDQERPDTLWLGEVTGNRELSRGAAQEGEQSRRLSFLPPGHPQGYEDAFDGFVADVYAAVAGEVPDGLPRFEDGLRAAVLTEAVLRSSQERRWVEVE